MLWLSERTALLLSGWHFVAIAANLLSRWRRMLLPRPANVSRLPPDCTRTSWPNGLHALDVLTEYPSTRPCDRRMCGGADVIDTEDVTLSYTSGAQSSLGDTLSGDSVLTPLTRTNDTPCSRCSAFPRSETCIARSIVFSSGAQNSSRCLTSEHV
jgi:hypothetical protein